MEKTVSNIIDMIGAQALAEKLDLHPNSVYEARRKGIFPSSWTLVVREAALEQGIDDLPDALFSFRHQKKPVTPAGFAIDECAI